MWEWHCSSWVALQKVLISFTSEQQKQVDPDVASTETMQKAFERIQKKNEELMSLLQVSICKNIALSKTENTDQKSNLVPEEKYIQGSVEKEIWSILS